jgi:Holliday junction resolvase-like predicted endonuclease
MQIYILFFFIIAIPNVKLLNLINNHNKKICADCKFFISNKNECSKFGEVNIITGKYNYEPAVEVRNDYNKCGEDAIFLKKKKLFKIYLYYF